MSVLVVDPATPAIVYAGTQYVGVFKSTDGGGTWAPANKGLAYLYVKALAIDPSTPTTLYAAGGYGVFKSTDAGATWAPASTGLTDLYTTALAVDPSTPTTLYAAAGGGVFKSTDAGGTWAAASVGLRYVYVLAIDPTTPTTLYAATAGGIFKSTDASATWVATTGLPYRVYVLAVSPSSPSTVYAGTEWGGVYRSTDGGGHWTAANVGLTDLDVSALAIDPSTPSTIYAGTTGGISRSTDAGDSWVAVNTGLTGALWGKALAIDPTTPSTIYAGMSDKGVFKSIDSGDHWTAPGIGLTGVDMHAVAIDPETPATLYAGTGDRGVYKSTDAGGTWAAVNAGLPSPIPSVDALAIDPSTPATLYAGTWDGVFKSTDAGAEWTASSVGLDPYPHVRALAIDPTNPSTIYAGTWNGTFKSADSGGTWAPANAGMTRWASVGALAIDPTNPSTLYAGTFPYGVFKSTNSGATWTAINTGLADLFVDALVIDPSQPTALYAGSRSGVFRSVNGGATWGFAGLNLSVSALAVDPANPPTIYAGTIVDTGSEGGGVFRSTDGGRTWTAVNKGLPTPNVLALALDSSGPTTLYAALWLASVWQATPPAGPDADLALTLSDSPDPVVGTTTLTYTIAVSNAGPFSAGSVSVSHTFPAGVVFDGAWGSGWTCGESAGVVTCTRPGLAVGKAPVITVHVTPGPVATILFSSATVSAVESDPNPANNSDNETTNVIAPLVWMGTRTKTVLADGGEFVINGGVTYAITLTNAGPSTQADNPGHELADILPTSLGLVSADATAGTVAADPPVNAVTWDGSLPSGGSVTITIHATIRPRVALGATIANQATVYYDADASGTNEATALTDDPGKPGANDPTSFVVVSPPTGFFTVPPCRLVDTREAVGPYGGPALVAGADRVFIVFEQCSIPSTARAVSVNLTVTEPSAAGNLRLYPAGTPPPVASPLNYSAGQTRGSNAVVTLNGLGEFAVRCAQASGTAHLVIDVNGYFE